MKFRVAALVAGLLFAASAYPRPPEEWHFKDWPAAVAQSRAERRPLFVLFGFEECPWCRNLYRGAMSDENLRAEYQSKVVLTYFDTRLYGNDQRLEFPDGSSVTAAEIIKRLHAYPTPSWVFISPRGVVLIANRGSMTTAAEMRRDLEAAILKSVAP